MSVRTQRATTTAGLSAYLNDHLGGSRVAVDLIDTTRAEAEGTPLADLLARLKAEIEADRSTLEDVMGRLGIPASSLKQAAGRVAEKVSRIRLSERVTGSPATSRLFALETLSLGIEGKRVLWIAVRATAGGDPRLAGIDFDDLIARAEEQRQALEPCRLEAAAEAFSP